MPVESWWAGVVAGLAIAVPVGAVGTYLLSLSAKSPLRVALAGALGVACADALYALLAVLGGQAVVTWIAPVAGWLRTASAVVLLGLAIRTVLGAVRDYRSHQQGQVRADAPPSAWRSFAQLATITTLNPATITYFATVVLGAQASRVVSGGAVQQWTGAGLFVVGVLVGSGSWNAVLVAGGTMVGRVLSTPRGKLGTAVVAAVLMAALAIVMITA